MEILKPELIELITDHLLPPDIISFGLSSASLYKILAVKLEELQKLHEKFHQCTAEIESGWNSLVPEAEYLAKLKRDEYKSSVCCGWQVDREDEFNCSIYPDKTHFIKVVYVHNPRDVDMLAWFLDNEKMGMNML